jgi:uncharacterized membrane protein
MEFSALFDNLATVALLLAAPWILLALFSAFSDALVGYIDEWLLKRIKGERGSEVDAPGRLVLISGFFGLVIALGAALVSTFSGDQYTLAVPIGSLLQAVAAGALEVIWLIPYFYALQRGGALNATPLFQTIPIFSLIFGLLIFSEVPTSLHILATLIIIGGAYVLNYSPQNHRLDAITVGLMLVSSALISFGFFMFKDATLAGNFIASLFGHGLGMFAISSGIYATWTPYRRQFNDFIRNADFKVLAAQLCNEGLYSIGAIAHQLAIVLGPSVMVVSALSAFHPLFTLGIAATLAAAGSTEHRAVLQKDQRYHKIAAIVLIAGGTVLIAL